MWLSNGSIVWCRPSFKRWGGGKLTVQQITYKYNINIEIEHFSLVHAIYKYKCFIFAIHKQILRYMK